MNKKIFVTLAIATIMSIASNAQNPYIDKVYEFCPAPGQFINTMPICKPGEDAEAIREKAETNLKKNSMVCLGAYGGYVVFGFDHTVENKYGYYDLLITGNAFYSNANPNTETTREGGSSEPGIVMVSYDANENGEPDDEWYELAGSEYYSPETIHNYEITYYRPDSNHVAIPSTQNKILIDSAYVRWTDNQGNEGYVAKNAYHKQNYYPNWIEEDSITFSGTKLANNAVDESGKGTYYVLYMYGYGYVDNHPNNDNRSKFNIDWAVDKDGKPVDLPGIDFVKVYTALNQYAGWLGETSTEVAGATDLHVTGEDSEDITGISALRRPHTTNDEYYYDLFGRKVENPSNGIFIYKGKKIYIQ